VSMVGKSVQELFGNNLDSATISGFSGGWVLQGFSDHCQETITEMHSAKISRSATLMPNNSL
jgi:hypothetical protein